MDVIGVSAEFLAQWVTGVSPTVTQQLYKLHIPHGRALAGCGDTGHVGDDGDVAGLGLEPVRARG